MKRAEVFPCTDQEPVFSIPEKSISAQCLGQCSRLLLSTSNLSHRFRIQEKYIGLVKQNLVYYLTTSFYILTRELT